MVEGRRTAAYAQNMPPTRANLAFKDARRVHHALRRAPAACGFARAGRRRRARQRRFPLHCAGRRFADAAPSPGASEPSQRECGSRADEHVRHPCADAHSGAGAPAVHDRRSDLHGRPRRYGVLLLPRQSRRLGKGEIRGSLRSQSVGYVRATSSAAPVHHQVADGAELVFAVRQTIYGLWQR